MILLPTPNGFLASGAAAVIGDDGHQLKAWAERYVRDDPDIRWLLGNYVEADQANDNGHIFPAEDLRAAQHTLAGKPLNMMHREHYIVGYFAGAQLVDTDGEELTAAVPDEHPRVEALAGIWHTRFPEEMFNIRQAHKEGALFFSMETVPEEVSCPTCMHRAAFAGFESETYCEHMQGATAPKRLHRPHFAGGAIIIPPVRPGWSRADVKAISKVIEENYQMESEALMAQIENEAPHLSPAEWREIMGHIVALAAREFPPEMREKMGKKGSAMPDGSFPIANAQDLKNAIRAVGRAKDPAAAKAHIKSRAKALGLTDLVPDGW